VSFNETKVSFNETRNSLENTMSLSLESQIKKLPQELKEHIYTMSRMKVYVAAICHYDYYGPHFDIIGVYSDKLYAYKIALSTEFITNCQSYDIDIDKDISDAIRLMELEGKPFLQPRLKDYIKYGKRIKNL